MPTPMPQTQGGSEESRIDEAIGGNERSFRELVAPYRAELQVHCYRMLGSPQDAEDLVQETLFRAWRRLGRFERRSSMRTWLYRIATNACLDELERRPRRAEPVQPYPDGTDEIAPEIADPAARYAQREGMELAFLAAIQQLPGRQRAILILRDVLGWSSSEVADLLDTTVAGVNSGLQRARATIDPDLPAVAVSAAGPKTRKLLSRYVDAWERVDIEGLVSLLQQDAALRMPPQPSVVGAQSIGRFFESVAGGCGIGRIPIELSSANGRPALVMYRATDDGGREPHGILLLETSGDLVSALDAFIDPGLVRFFEAPGCAAPHPSG